MVYKVIDGKEDYIKNYGNVIEISIDVFSCLENPSKLFEKTILSDEFFTLMHFPKKVILLVVDVVINNKDINYLKNKLTEYNIPLYSLIINIANNYKRKYHDFQLSKETDEITIVCAKDNFIKILELSKRINKKINIDGQNISLSDYKIMLDNYDVNSLNNVSIKYQEQNSSISVKELYKMAIFIDNIIQGIKQYNLSPLEKIIYTYDIVKYRKYKESYGNLRYSRDLDKVVQGDNIVCVGYSNLFNAILRGMGFNAVSLISIEKRHQRSMVYIRDKKYNIDGIYVFDPTFDSRKNNDYINNYKYFAIIMEKSEKDNPSTHKLKPWTTFEELINIYELKDDECFKERLNELDDLEDLFEFTNKDGVSIIIDTLETYSYAGYEEKTNARNIYKNFMKKYKPEEISASVFFNALLRTRIIEYYNGVISCFDIDKIIDASTRRSVFQKVNYEDDRNSAIKILDAMEYDGEIYDVLEKIGLDNQEVLEMDKLRVRLLKVLRNGRK